MPASDTEELKQLYKDLCSHSVEKNASGIAALLAPEYVLVHMTGTRQGAAEYVASVMDGTLNYFETTHDSIAVTVAPDGQTATIRGRSRTLAAVYGGGRHWWHLQQDLKAHKVDGVWKLTESRASTY